MPIMAMTRGEIFGLELSSRNSRGGGGGKMM
jgi:hypothetical protein